jgi:heme/copper-type cytochrome/quinol oxidase subunit 3
MNPICYLTLALILLISAIGVIPLTINMSSDDYTKIERNKKLLKWQIMTGVLGLLFLCLGFYKFFHY